MLNTKKIYIIIYHLILENQQNSAPNAQELLKENLMLRKNIEILQKQTLVYIKLLLIKYGDI